MTSERNTVHAGKVTVTFERVHRAQEGVVRVMALRDIYVQRVEFNGGDVLLEFAINQCARFELAPGANARGRGAALMAVERALRDDPRGATQCAHPRREVTGVESDVVPQAVVACLDCGAVDTMPASSARAAGIPLRGAEP